MQDMTAPNAAGEPAKRDPNYREGQEDIDASKAPLMEHLIELRQRLIYTLIGIAIAFVFCFAFATLKPWPSALVQVIPDFFEVQVRAPRLSSSRPFQRSQCRPVSGWGVEDSVMIGPFVSDDSRFTIGRLRCRHRAAA
mgnify:CR=1 FL=1